MRRPQPSIRTPLPASTPLRNRHLHQPHPSPSDLDPSSLGGEEKKKPKRGTVFTGTAAGGSEKEIVGVSDASGRGSFCLFEWLQRDCVQLS